MIIIQWYTYSNEKKYIYIIFIVISLARLPSKLRFLLACAIDNRYMGWTVILISFYYLIPIIMYKILAQ